MTSSLEVRGDLIDALQLDLIGPGGSLGDPHETLDQQPSRWYLTGFLVPTDAPPEQRFDPTGQDELDQGGEPSDIGEEGASDPAAARRSYFPGSVGLSTIVTAETTELAVTVRYGEYLRIERFVEQEGVSDEEREEGTQFRLPPHWQRTPHEETLAVKLPVATDRPGAMDVPRGRGLQVVWTVKPIGTQAGAASALGLPEGCRTVSVFLVNNRAPLPTDTDDPKSRKTAEEAADEANVFQASLEVHCEQSLVPRSNMQATASDDLDEQIADLQYRDHYEFGVGHGVSVEADCDGPVCHTLRTCWLPTAEVERVEPAHIEGLSAEALQMDRLANLASAEEAQALLGPLTKRYRVWVEEQRTGLDRLTEKRQEIADYLLHEATRAAGRIDAGIEQLADADCLLAFQVANRAMSAQAKQRFGVQQGKAAAEITPTWRPFQLAFLLMNLRGVAEPSHVDRKLVDLLFFPTGGGKTEAYLGLAAFTIVLRRLRYDGPLSSGLSVLMRYTLRLLTLDQLGRATALICALELERRRDVETLGRWPFEIGLWVGRAATPNRMGKKGDKDPECAYRKTIAYQNNSQSKPAPIPLETCPWCGERFTPRSFNLAPDASNPTDLHVTCMNRRCAFSAASRGGPGRLPILSVDEPIYRRLPCFLIATVDKFAAMPWTGEVGKLFGRVSRHDDQGFYGPCEPGVGHPLPPHSVLSPAEGQPSRLPPPDLIVQDELHLISGPLGTIVGLYETALDKLSESPAASTGEPVRPKVIASTATVRRASKQIRALFNRTQVEVFPPPGPDVRDSFFARTVSPNVRPARKYVGIAAQGRSAKVIMLRSYLALLAAGQSAYLAAGGAKTAANPADPYMTLLGYFNSLRELGGARRLIEDEVRTQLLDRTSRKRVEETHGLFANRTIDFEPVELTSRVPTNEVADAKRRLELSFDQKGRVDVAIATNMISVGLDITRLGLMVCFGQPKTSSEYIQATSRVGRNADLPGLVVTILNVHRPRDRSHYERFTAFHRSFYRGVEATSVTPFSPRALDRALAATLVALVRQGDPKFTPAEGAAEVLPHSQDANWATDTIAARVRETLGLEVGHELEQKVIDRCKVLRDNWSQIAHEQHETGGTLQYQREKGGSRPLLRQFLDPELENLTSKHRSFRANRSMRDVEPSVGLWVKTLDNIDLETEGGS